MCSQNNETVILEVLEIDFFSSLNHGRQAFTVFQKNSFRRFYYLVVESLSFLKIIEIKNL